MSGVGLPAELAADLALPARPRDQALLLLSVDENGAPRVALLSRAEVHVVRDDLVLLALWPTSRSTANLERSGAATLFWTVDAKAVSVVLRRVRSEPLGGASTGEPEGRAPRALVLHVVDVRADEVGYAELAAPLTFALHDPDEVLPRWEEVAQRLAALGRRLRDDQ